MKANQKIIIAKIGKSYRLKGEFKIYSWADPIENVFELKPWLMKFDAKQLEALESYNPDFKNQIQSVTEGFYQIELESSKILGKDLIAKIVGIDSPEAIRSLTNHEIHVPRSALPQPTDGQYYWVDLIGAAVQNQNGKILGQVVNIIETKSNSVLEILPNSGDDEAHPQPLLIPFIPIFIKKVDLNKAHIWVEWEED